jgi:hypothetical protein
MKKLFALFAIASAHRVSVKEYEAGSKKEIGLALGQTPVPAFLASHTAVISPELAVLPGENLILEVQEHRKAGDRPAEYSVYITGKNGKPYPTPTYVGRQTSLWNPFGMSHLTFKDGQKKPKSITTLHINYSPSMSTLIRAHVAPVIKGKNHRKLVPYYTFEMASKRGMRQQQMQGNLGAVNRAEEVFNVYKGKCESKKKCGTPHIVAKGHFLGFNFQFFQAGAAEPIAFMTMIDSEHSVWKGSKQRYRVTVNGGGDPLMLAQLIGFIDQCNNFER